MRISLIVIFVFCMLLCGCKAVVVKAVVVEKIGEVFEHDQIVEGRKYYIKEILCNFSNADQIAKKIRNNLVREGGRCFVDEATKDDAIPVVITISEDFSKFEDARWGGVLYTLGTVLWWHGSLYCLPLIMHGHYAIEIKISCKGRGDVSAKIGYHTKEFVCWYPKWYIDDEETFVCPVGKYSSSIQEWVCTEDFAKEIAETAIRLPLDSCGEVGNK